MDLRNRTTTFKYYSLIILIPILVMIGFLLRDSIFHLLQILPPCPIYQYFHILCPACGNTRSIAAFLDGNILLAIHYNPVPYLVLFFGLLAYIQLCLSAGGKHVQLLPRKLSFYLSLIGFIVIFLIARNFIPTLFPEFLL